jgi:hypothetical protein
LFLSINIEFLHGDTCVKYVTKYALKGPDMAFVHAYAPAGRTGFIDYDEFNQLRTAKFVTAQEAYLALWGYPIVWMTHSVN